MCVHILKEEHIDGPKRLEYWVVLSSNKNKDINFCMQVNFNGRTTKKLGFVLFFQNNSIS